MYKAADKKEETEINFILMSCTPEWQVALLKPKVMNNNHFYKLYSISRSKSGDDIGNNRVLLHDMLRA